MTEAMVHHDIYQVVVVCGIIIYLLFQVLRQVRIKRLKDYTTWELEEELKIRKGE